MYESNPAKLLLLYVESDLQMYVFQEGKKTSKGGQNHGIVARVAMR